jgi:hypothetical protein
MGKRDSATSEFVSKAGFCEHGNGPLSYTRDREFLDQMKNYKLFKENLALPPCCYY